jgi:hypothetical protein
MHVLEVAKQGGHAVPPGPSDPPIPPTPPLPPVIVTVSVE